MKGKLVRLCELCNQEANIYCDSDAALLCFSCDSTVHNANFLVARHLRRMVCPTCGSLTGKTYSGVRSFPLHGLACDCCSRDSISCSSSSTLSSACISTTEASSRLDRKKKTAKFSSSSSMMEVSRRRKNVSVKKGKCLRVGARSRAEEWAEGVFVNWCKRLGVNGSLVVSTAVHAMGMCLGGLLGKALPFRVSLAASFWVGVRFCGDKSLCTWENLRGLEEASGAPAKVILGVEMKLENVLRARNSGVGLEEGWAEC